MNKVISFGDVEKALRELAQEAPDNKYTKVETSTGNMGACFYTKGNCSNGSVGCIVGQALLRAGLDLKTLKGVDYGGVQQGADTVLRELGILSTENNWAWINQVQNFQDRGETWENAIRLADSNIPRGETHG